MITRTVACLIWFLASFIVVGDMFRKGTKIGWWGVVLLPIFPLIWVVRFYSGNRLIIAPLLFGSWIVFFSSFSTIRSDTPRDTSPPVPQQNILAVELDAFVDAANRMGLIECSQSSLELEEERYSLVLSARALEDLELPYDMDISEVIQRYREVYIDPILPYYPESLKNDKQKTIVIALQTELESITYFKIESPGVVTKIWR